MHVLGLQRTILKGDDSDAALESLQPDRHCAPLYYGPQALLPFLRSLRADVGMVRRVPCGI